VAFRGWADFDQDRRITFVDYQRWLAALRSYQAGVAARAAAAQGRACGLLGIELLPVFALAWRRHKRRQQR
jgi:hypothetical protein